MGKLLKQAVGLTVLFILLGFSNGIYAQKAITGVVKDAANGGTLPGVNVTVKEKAGVGTVTDIDGKFSLKLPEGAKTLVFSFIGYTSQDVAIAGKTSIEVQLQADSRKLDEVVVTALGVKREVKSLGYAFTDVKGDKLAQANTVSPLNALQGKVAGVQIDNVGSSVAAAPRVVVRGNNTFDANNQPIVVLDGIVLQNEVSTGSQNWGNALKNLNPSDIESMSVLRGAAATALYGSQALNGVILVTTKSGKSAKGIGVEVSHNTSYSIYQQPYDYQNEFGSGNYAGANTQLSNKYFTTQEFPKVNGKDKIYKSSLNWGPRMLGQKVVDYVGDEVSFIAQKNNWKDLLANSYTTSTNIALASSNDRLTYRTSFTYQNSQGMFKRNGFEKYNIDLNTSYKFNDYVKVKAHVVYIPNKQTNPAYLSVDGTYSLARTFFGWNGLTRNYDVLKFNNPKYYLSQANPDRPMPPQVPTDLGYNVPIISKLFYYNNWQDESQRENNFLGNFSMDIDPFKWLTITVGANGNATFTKYARFRWYDYGDKSTRMSKYMTESFFKDYFAKIAYHNDFLNNDLTVNASVQFQRQQWEAERLGGEAKIHTIPGYWFWDNFPDVGENNRIQGSVFNTRKVNSVASFLDVSYKDQLFLSLTARNDWSSTLVYSDGHGNPSFFYPSASLSWLVNRTFTLPEWVTFAKIRGSYGETGGAPSPYVINGGYTASIYSYLNNPGMAFSSKSLPNLDLKPYKMRELEFGFNTRFFQNRLGLDFAWYRRGTVNQILDLPIASESGVLAIQVNAGEIRNTGIELTLDATPIRTNDFSWDINANYTWQKSKVVDLYDGITRKDLANGYTTYSGAAARAYKGGTFGLISASNMPKVYINPENPNDPNNGKFIADWNEDTGTINYTNSGEEQLAGNINPKFIANLGNTLNYKNLSLDFQFYFKIGGHIASSTYTTGILASGNGKSSLAYRDKEHGGIVFTTKDGSQGNATFEDGYIPSNVIFNQGVTVNGKNVGGMSYDDAVKAGIAYPSHISSYYCDNYYGQGIAGNNVLENSYITLKNISLSYSLPQKLVAKANLTKLSLSVYARDLAVLYNTLPDHMNPYVLNSNESGAFTDGEGVLPFITTVGFSVNFGF